MTNSTLTLRAHDIPSIYKFAVGFDSMLDELLRISPAQQTNYPPFNLLKIDEDTFHIEIAVAGFKEGEIDVTIEKNLLTVKGAKKDGIPDNIEYLHRGVSTRNFERTFPLGPNIEVKGAVIRDGMLIIDLVREVPEEEKPKSIAISYIK
jgi:molecular chaperone IbpA